MPTERWADRRPFKPRQASPDAASRLEYLRGVEYLRWGYRPREVLNPREVLDPCGQRGATPDRLGWTVASVGFVRTLVLDPQPPELMELLERRRLRGLDLFDEVWEGTYHMAPAPRFRRGDVDQQLAEILGPAARRVGLTASGPFNVGGPDDYRVPDRGLLRTPPNPEAVYLPTAALVVEIVSPGDETYDKLPFYVAHAVEEILVVDPETRSVQLLSLAGGTYEARDRSEVIGLMVSDIVASIRWPNG